MCKLRNMPPISVLTLWTIVTDLIILHKYKFFIGSLERSDRAVSETSRAFEKKLEKLRGKKNWPLRTQYMAN